MAVITDATEASWAAGITLSATEFWQVSEGGACRFTHEASPAINDGAYVPTLAGLTFAAGQTIRYRLATSQPAVITRTQVA
jgi:hypothetical protein